MNTVDELLKTIVNAPLETVSEDLATRDVKALKNLARLVDSTQYITENQAKLVVKILKENLSSLKKFQADIEETTASPKWARNFRVIQHVRKIYVSNDHDIPQIIIETTYSSELQKEILKLSKSVEGLYAINNGKSYGAALTEKNIVEIIDRLKNFKFMVSDDLKDYYKTIKSWSKIDIENQYRITTISHPNFEKQIIADLGIETAIDQTIICDRSIRYQYFVEKTENLPENLPNLIATRDSTKVWVDNKIFSLGNVVKAIIEIKRFPMLVVLDTRDEKKCLENLKNLSESLEENVIFDKVGVYFRLDNDTTGKEFNQFIANKKYNCQLDTNTKVVVVQSGKIPKFLLKNAWKPMSVVSINYPLRHSKTAIYANCCDLIITYTDDKPIIESRYPWE